MGGLRPQPGSRLLQGNDQFAVWFRHNDAANKRLFGTYVNKTHTGEAWENGAFQQQPRVPLAQALRPGFWNTVRIVVRGDLGECFFNGQRIYSYSVSGSPTGNVGLRCWKAAFAFRNIKVTSAQRYGAARRAAGPGRGRVIRRAPRSFLAVHCSLIVAASPTR